MTALCLPPQMLNVQHQQTLGDAISNRKWERKDITQWKSVQHETHVENPRKYYQLVFQKTIGKYCQNCERGLHFYRDNSSNAKPFYKWEKLKLPTSLLSKSCCWKNFILEYLTQIESTTSWGAYFAQCSLLPLMNFAKLYLARWQLR